jgi:hypothetical protein
VLLKQHHFKKTEELNLRKVILLDSQSTMDLFCDEDMVNTITKTTQTMKLKSNGGCMTTKKKATINGYKKRVWFNKDAITNIFSLKNLTEQYRVTYDSDDKKFVVHREKDGKPNMEFRMHPSGLHFFDPEEMHYVFVNTVTGNKEGFTKRQIQGAENARSLYATLSYPSPADFRWAVNSNQIRNCPATVEDIDTAIAIWGKDISALKGKTTRSSSDHVASSDIIKVPPDILKLHKDVCLAIDIFLSTRFLFLSL